MGQNSAEVRRDPAERVRIVLVEPASAGNIGAVARVMKNTGFGDLVLVVPSAGGGAWRTPEAEWMAHGAGEVLHGVHVDEDLASAVSDRHVVIGTTHRTGRLRVVEDDYRGVLSAAAALVASGQRLALVFGREKDGLSRDELQCCQRLIRIPAAVPYPSFNLSHAVLLVAYELYRRLGEPLPRQPTAPLATARQLDLLVDHILRALERIGFHAFNEDAGTFERVLRRFLGRTPLERRDAAVLHRICGQIDKFAARWRRP